MKNEWLEHIKKTTAEDGSLATKDERGKSIVIEWERADILSPSLAHFKSSSCDLASEEIAPTELQFLRAHPEAAPQELFLTACVPLLKNGVGSKVINLLVSSGECGRGLEKAMLSSIFKLIPQTRRIFLFVRPTNEIALEMYRALEFVPDIDLLLDPNHKVNINYWTPLEYRIELGQVLQKTAGCLKVVSECQKIFAVPLWSCRHGN